MHGLGGNRKGIGHSVQSNMNTQNTTHPLKLIMHGGKGEKYGHFQSYMHTQNTTHLLKLTVSWEKGRGIDHFQSYMHTQNTTHYLELKMDWEEKGTGIGLIYSYMHGHTKHNSPPEFDNGLGGKEEGHWSLPVIHAHTKQNSPSKVD